MKEKCVLCGKDTPYETTTPVQYRKCYMDGAGQLCEICFCETYMK